MYAFDVFLNSMDRLFDAEESTGKNLVITKDDLFVILSYNFRKSIEMQLAKDKSNKTVNSIMKDFRTLGLIICEDPRRTTNVMWLGGKTRRVVKIDRARFEYLKEHLH